MPESASPRARRIWMAASWLFLVAYILGVALLKAPDYARLYGSLEMRDLPAPTAFMLSACAFVASWWFVAAPLLLIPLVFVVRGTLDRRTGPFTVIVILALFVVISASSIFLFLPMSKVRQKIQEQRQK